MTATAEKNTGLDVTQEQMEKFLDTCRRTPIIYVDTVLLPKMHIKLDKDQREVLTDMFRLKKCLIPTHHAFGKSTLCAIFAITMLNLYPTDCIITTLAPTFRQVKDILWVEMRRIYRKCYGPPFVNGQMDLVRYEISEKAFAVGFSPSKSAKGADVPQVLSGTHAKVVIVIIDEAGGVEDQIFDQLEGIISAGAIVYVICIGNPLSTARRFGRMCLTEDGEGYFIIHKKAYEAPNMVANGLTSLNAIRAEADRIRPLSREKRIECYENKHYKRPYQTLLSPGWVMKCYLKWGESPLFYSRCIGEWAQTADDVLVTLARATEIMYGTFTNEEGQKTWTSEQNGFAKWDGVGSLFTGIDTSGDGKDKRVLFTLEGNRQFHYKEFMKTYERNTEASRVDYHGTKLKEDGKYIAKYIYDNLIKPYPTRLHTIYIDCTGGFGDSIYDNLMALPLAHKFIRVRKVNFAESAKNEKDFHDIIAEMAWTMAEMINSADGLLLEPNDDLKNQLTWRKTKSDNDGKNMLEEKKPYKVRAGSSPDEFDSLMLACYARASKGGSDNLRRAMQQANELMSTKKKPEQKSIPIPSDNDEREEY